ncbi:NAD(P)H-binding protein, partial [bacterium]|nr:NAD(P)H-binding protein [bacterium]
MTPTRILITGSTGFIGTRLCERLQLAYRLPWRAGVRNFGRAPRIARLDPDMVALDLLRPATITAALAGCDAVVHLAHGEDNEAPTATRNLVAACRRARLKRFIHVSSVSVHGPAPGPECAIEATATIGRYGESYCDAKAR